LHFAFRGGGIDVSDFRTTHRGLTAEVAPIYTGINFIALVILVGTEFLRGGPAGFFNPFSLGNSRNLVSHFRNLS
jgi:hypothetical protein